MSDLLQIQAEKIAKTLKAMERGEEISGRFAEHIKEVREHEEYFWINLVMDDKVLRLEICWHVIADHTEEALADYIYSLMADKPLH